MRESKLFPPEVMRALRANGEASLHAHASIRHVPVVKIFNPHGSAMWLLSELDPTESDHLYGIADMGRGCPLLGYVSREGLETAYVPHQGYRIPLERDPTFAPLYNLAVYIHAARLARRIVETPADLARSAAAIAG